MTDKGDFSQSSITGHIFRLAAPAFLAELVNVLYSLVDRMYIGHISETGTLALSAIGVVFPLISFITAFASLLGTGGGPLCAIERGKKNDQRAQAIMETAFALLIAVGLVLTASLLVFSRPLLLLMGANEQTIGYASGYFRIYLIGTVFVMISLGANPFIITQGRSTVAMGTVLIGAILNTVLDPLFIFTLGLGVKGAAIATVISQAASAAWATIALCSRSSCLRIRRLKIHKGITKPILQLGVTGFMFKVTNSLTQAVANVTLQLYSNGMDTLYIGAMSIINSIREISSLATSSVTSSAQTIASYNYGARCYSKDRATIRIATAANLACTLAVYAVVQIWPRPLISIFTSDEALIELTARCMRIFFAVFFMMSFQSVGQTAFIAHNCPKRAVFFSLLRKAMLVIPLTIILPRAGLGIDGVFWAEALSQLIGATATFSTMYFTVYRKLRKAKDGEALAV